MNQNPQQQPNKADLGEMHPMEIDLILTLRHEFRFGEVEIEMRDGLPQHLLRTVNRRKLGKFAVMHNKDLRSKYPELYNKVASKE